MASGEERLEPHPLSDEELSEEGAVAGQSRDVAEGPHHNDPPGRLLSPTSKQHCSLKGVPSKAMQLAKLAKCI